MKKVLLLIGVIFLLTGCFSNPEEEATPELLKENVEVRKEKSIDNKEIVFVKNNNSKNVSVNIEIDYLNNEDTVIYNEAKSVLSIGGKKEVALEVNAPESYDDSNIKLDVNNPYSIIDYSDNVEIKDKNGSLINAIVKNTGDKTIMTIDLAIVYYQNKKIVGYDSQKIFDLKKDKTETISFLKPMDNNHNYIKFDDYKIYLNCAFDIEVEIDFNEE